ncbi:uncharacterized protein LOC106056088 isoform X2 [Biomphalaria glabrata]|uniref:Uncharacterized protein LOC106056088 isoform X2 n=1 Tax=Biomphalaria glabrata TaxID=6526 RepID=A0A9W2YNQ2_BIOGL|nr:uncharacterized protein LOC106056088 isoform X2 [Biomphalaria glabrata]
MEEGRPNPVLHEVSGKGALSRFPASQHHNVTESGKQEESDDSLPLHKDAHLKVNVSTPSSGTVNNGIPHALSISSKQMVALKPDQSQNSEDSDSIKYPSGFATSPKDVNQELDRVDSKFVGSPYASEKSDSTNQQMKDQTSRAFQSFISQTSSHPNNNNNDKTLSSCSHLTNLLPSYCSTSESDYAAKASRGSTPNAQLSCVAPLDSNEESGMLGTQGREAVKLQVGSMPLLQHLNPGADLRKKAETQGQDIHKGSIPAGLKYFSEHPKTVMENDKKESYLLLEEKGNKESQQGFLNSLSPSDNISSFRSVTFNQNSDSQRKTEQCLPLSVDTSVGSSHLLLNDLPSVSNSHPPSKPRKSRSKESKRKLAAERRLAELNDEDDDNNDFIPVGMLQLSKKPDTSHLASLVDDSFSQGLQPHSQFTGQLAQQIDYQIQELKAHNFQSEMNTNVSRSGTQQAGYHLQQLAQKLDPKLDSSQQMLLHLVQQAQQQKHLLDKQKQNRQMQEQLSSLTFSAQSQNKNQNVHGGHPHHQQSNVNSVFQDVAGQFPFETQVAKATGLPSISSRGNGSTPDAQYSFQPTDEQQRQTLGSYTDIAVSGDKLQLLNASNTPAKLAEQLLQSSKSEQDFNLNHNNSIHSDKSSFRSITPVILPNPNGPLNQQHPEITKMLSSPVSPRQSISPRQTVSPRRTVSPNPFSDNLSHFASPQPRQAISMRQSPKQTGSVSSATHQSVFGTSSSPQHKQPSVTWRPVSPFQPSPASPSNTLSSVHQLQAQTLVNYHSNEGKPVQHPDLIGQPVTINLGELPSNQESLQHKPFSQMQPVSSNSLSGHDDDLMASPSSIPAHQLPQVFSPGQVIHHRPPDRKKKNTRPSGHRGPPLVVHTTPMANMSSNVPVPSVHNASAIWQQMQSKDNKNRLSNEVFPRQHDQPVSTVSQSADFESHSSQHIQSRQQNMQKINQSSEESHSMLQQINVTEIYHVQTQQITTKSVNNICSLEKQNSPASSPAMETKLTEEESVNKMEPCTLQTDDGVNSGGKMTITDTSVEQNTRSDCLDKLSDESTSLSVKSGIDNGLKVLSEIASERYVMDVAEDSEQPTSDRIAKEKSAVTSSTMEVDCHLQDIKVTGANSVNKTAPTELSTDSHVPKREVRQRKPKKPFEQEETPVRRNQKTVISNQKSTPAPASHKKQPVLSLTPLSQKKPVLNNKSHPKVIGDMLQTEEEKATKPKEVASAPSQLHKSVAGKKHTDSSKGYDEDSESDSKSDHTRRLSQRLLVKEKEKEQKKNEGTDDSTRRSQRHSARIDYKEATDSVDDTLTQKNAKTVKTLNTSHQEDIVGDKQDRMKTRSKNRKEDSEDKPANKKVKGDDSEDKPANKKVKGDDSEDKPANKKVKGDNSEEKPANKNRKEGDTEEKPAIKNGKESTEEKPAHKNHKDDTEEKLAHKNSKDDDSHEKSANKKLKDDKSEVGVSVKKQNDDANHTPVLRNRKKDKQGHMSSVEENKDDPISKAQSAEMKNVKKAKLEKNKTIKRLQIKTVPLTLIESSPATEASSVKEVSSVTRRTTRLFMTEGENSSNTDSACKPQRLAPSEFIDELPITRKRSRKSGVRESQLKLDLATEPISQTETNKDNENELKSKSLVANGKAPIPVARNKSRKRHHDYRKRSRKRRALKAIVVKRAVSRETPESKTCEVETSVSASNTDGGDKGTFPADPVDCKDEGEAKKPKIEQEKEQEKLECPITMAPSSKEESEDVPFTELEPKDSSKNVTMKSEFQQPLCKALPTLATSSTPNPSTSVTSSASSNTSLTEIAVSPQTSGKVEELAQTSAVRERRKMTMYRLVPVVGEEISDLEVSDALIPLSGYFVPGGNNDRVLLPQNFISGFAPSKASSVDTSLTFGQTSSSPQARPASHQPSWPSEVNYSKSSSVNHGMTNSLQSMSVFSPLKTSHKINDNVVGSWTSEPHPPMSSWPNQLPQSINTPPPSVGEPKKPWTTPQPQPSPSAYGPSPSWNATPPSIMSSSPLSTSSSAWTVSSSSNVPSQPPHVAQAWSSTLQEPSWRSSPSASAAVTESWSKEYFPNSNVIMPEHSRQTENMDVEMSASNNTQMSRPMHQNYNFDSQHQSSGMYSNLDQPMSSNLSYETGLPQDADFSRPENLIQGLLRHVSSNSGGLNQDLAAFNLGQQDLAFLENRLRQTLSPNSLFSAVAALEDNIVPGPGGNQDNSLQDGMNLVHTVNLDIEEANLNSSAQLDLAGLGGQPSGHMNMARHLDSLHKAPPDSSNHIMTDMETAGMHPSVGPLEDSAFFDRSLAKDDSFDDHAKKEDKKVMKERKHLYDIVFIEGARKFKCKACSKVFNNTTIYRHLRVHDPDYKITVSCNMCDKTYTHKHSLDMHKKRFHGGGSTNIKVAGSSVAGEVVKEQEKLSPSKTNSEVKRQRKSSSSADPLASSPDETELQKQLETHRQVEELRRLKAEKKAHQKVAGQVDEIPSELDSDLKGEEPALSASEPHATAERAYPPDLSGDQFNFELEKEPESQKTDFGGSSESISTSMPVVTTLSHPLSQVHSAPKGHYQLNSPQPLMSTLAPVHQSSLQPPPSDGDAQYMNQGSLLESNVNPKPENEKFICKICNMQLLSKNSYLFHLRRHDKTKTKFCSYCDKSFYTCQELKSHERTHTGEKPYQCEICYTCFAHSGSFVSHKKGHTNRKEMEPFPIVDGQIQYPSTFRKPRLAGPKVEGAEKTKKKKNPGDSQQTGTNINTLSDVSPVPGGSANCPTSVIRKNSLDSGERQLQAGAKMDSRRLNMNDQLMNSSASHLYVSSLPEQQMVMSPSSSIQPSDTYSTPGSNVSGDYFNSYKSNSQPRHFLSPQLEASPQDYYSQGKYYPRTSSADQYTAENQEQIGAGKSQQYSSNLPQEYSQSVATSGSYFSSQESYSYDSNMDTSYQEEDFDSGLPSYKPDVSSSEIVKKLLQHYNVPASSYQEATSSDFGHQLEDYTRQGCETAPPMYSDHSVGVAAPPSYSASVQQKQYYSSHASSSLDYTSSVLMSSERSVQQESSMLLPQQQPEQYSNIHSQPRVQTESYRSDGTTRYSEVYSEGQYSQPSSQPAYSQQGYEVSLAPRDQYRQGLPKIESLARESTPKSQS